MEPDYFRTNRKTDSAFLEGANESPTDPPADRYPLCHPVVKTGGRISRCLASASAGIVQTRTIRTVHLLWLTFGSKPFVVLGAVGGARTGHFDCFKSGWSATGNGTRRAHSKHCPGPLLLQKRQMVVPDRAAIRRPLGILGS